MSPTDSPSFLKRACSCTWCYSRQTHADTKSISKIFYGGHKGQNHSELKTKDKKWNKKTVSHTFQSHGWWEGRRTLTLPSIFFYTTSLYLNRKCSVPTPASQTGLLTMWTHKPDVPSSFYADVKLSPWQSYTFTFKDPSHQSSKLCFMFKHKHTLLYHNKPVSPHFNMSERFLTSSCPVKI